jgi:hypothetical protein
MSETGPIYNVPLIDSLPIGGMFQQMPSRDDLMECSKRHMRVAASYEVLLNHYQQEIQKREAALDLISSFGGTGGSHHKDWVIDQITRVLTGDNYEAFVSSCCDGEDGPETYSWEVGTAP